MPTHRSLAGVVLAGGYSTRFGERDKAVADLAGTPMIRRVVDRVGEVTDAVVVNCREEQRDPIAAALDGCEPTVRYALDPVPDRGPVAGIRTGLSATDREYAAVVACDMPFVDPALLDRLFERARAADADAAVVRLDDGWLQTTQAVYRREPMRRACATALAEDGRIVTALAEIDPVVLEGDDLDGLDGRTFESVDTEAALAEAEARLGAVE
ncbi:molybdenum cofactor guanylyltransferase [Salinilacihabitans rarus]|uniref:molybdenum cofactor guanylyltransferase n=1 Tax=Salinilacihabitans rarus TaxID=2961596 RepID=UPI0020C91D9E|nr:molybdenum cofactor guanylyltransferase [Salinilacihabitans rarus]